MKQYYYKDIDHLISKIIPKNSKTINFDIKNNQLTSEKTFGKYQYLLLNNIIGDLEDIQNTLNNLHKYCTPESRLVIIYYNHLWEPILNLVSFLGLRRILKPQNWLDTKDLINFLNLSNFEFITEQRRFLFPFKLFFLGDLINKWIAPLPLINALCLTTCVIARPKPKPLKELSVSIIVPARNESGNIPNLTQKIPKFGKSQELIFIENNSTDNTWQVIQKEVQKKHQFLSLRSFQQKKIGKAATVRLGFSKAKGEFLIVLDSDLTVDPIELPKFYNAIRLGLGEFANGSRMIYPMEKDAMRTLNKIGNKLFSSLFTWILGQRFRDTLCGTKALLKKHYQVIEENRKIFGDFDPFEDFELIFGAVKQNLKVVEIPVRYKERRFGVTNISRFRHGLLLFKMTWIAFKRFKTI